MSAPLYQGPSIVNMNPGVSPEVAKPLATEWLNEGDTKGFWNANCWAFSNMPSSLFLAAWSPPRAPEMLRLNCVTRADVQDARSICEPPLLLDEVASIAIQEVQSFGPL